MAEIKLTKNELRAQQNRLVQLKKYLPTLQLKKAMLQLEVAEARLEILKALENFEKEYQEVKAFSPLLSEKISMNWEKAVKIKEVCKRYENSAGVDIPYFEKVEFEEISYSLFETPPWVDVVIHRLRKLIEDRIRVFIAEEKKKALEKELREVSIRVNLFEKILIPRALKNIKKIKVFLGDQQLAAVSQAKVAKAKIESHVKELSLNAL